MLISLTSPNGTKIKVHAPSVLRIRAALAHESEEAKTRIDGDRLALVQETPEEVARLVKEHEPAMAQFDLDPGAGVSTVWINAKRVTRAHPPRFGTTPPFHSYVQVGPFPQGLVETEEKANEILRKARETSA